MPAPTRTRFERVNARTKPTEGTYYGWWSARMMMDSGYCLYELIEPSEGLSPALQTVFEGVEALFVTVVTREPRCPFGFEGGIYVGRVGRWLKSHPKPNIHEMVRLKLPTIEFEFPNLLDFRVEPWFARTSTRHVQATFLEGARDHEGSTGDRRSPANVPLQPEERLRAGRG